MLLIATIIAFAGIVRIYHACLLDFFGTYNNITPNMYENKVDKLIHANAFKSPTIKLEVHLLTSD